MSARTGLRVLLKWYKDGIVERYPNKVSYQGITICSEIGYPIRLIHKQWEIYFNSYYAIRVYIRNGIFWCGTGDMQLRILVEKLLSKRDFYSLDQLLANYKF